MAQANSSFPAKQSPGAPIIYEVQVFYLRSRDETHISYEMPEEARRRLRETTQSPYWSRVALGFPILAPPAPFALVCFGEDADRYARFEAARRQPGLGKARFGFYPYQVGDAPDPGIPDSIPAIGLVDFMTIDALRRAQELLPDFRSIETSMLDPEAHYLVFLPGHAPVHGDTAASEHPSETGAPDWGRATTPSQEEA